ncbi:MAG: hypothetical protein ABIQ35_14600 [Verrucomicrobiota bacterium]
MKKNVSKSRGISLLLAGATLWAAALSSQAQTITTSYTNTFGSAEKTASWNYWYDLPQSSGSPTMGWDSTVDHTPSEAGSGSLPYFINWPGTSGGGQLQIYGTFAETGQYNLSQSIDATKYDSVSFDLRVDPSSPTNSNGDICRLTVGLFHTYAVYTITNIDIPTSATNGWVHYVCPIDKTTAPNSTDLTQGVGFNVNAYGGPNQILKAQTVPTKIWIDNLQVNVSLVENPPPTLSTKITEAAPGLNLFSAAGGDQYQRTNLKLNNTTGIGTLGASGDAGVSFAMTIKEFPDPVAYPGYQAHILITTGPGNNSALDYGDANLIFLDIKQNGDGSGNGTFRYKTNQPNGNSQVYGSGTLGQAVSSTILGTWTLKFSQGTNITVTGPDGAPFVTNITQEAANIFTEPLYVVFGGQPNQPGNLGQKVVLANASVTNSSTGTSIVYDNFLVDSALDTTKWSSLSGSQNTLFLFPNDPGQKVVKWTLPDDGFYLQVSTNLGSPWNSLVNYINFPASGFRNAIVPSSALGPKQNFFRLIKRSFTKLQILLPGETAAPGTLTGKTGTPTPQQSGATFDVVVNAVSADWFPITAVPDQQINLSSSDPAFTWPGFAGTMVNGKITFDAATWNLSLGTQGSQTITASDATDPTKTANTSSPVTVTP